MIGRSPLPLPSLAAARRAGASLLLVGLLVGIAGCGGALRLPFLASGPKPAAFRAAAGAALTNDEIDARLAGVAERVYGDPARRRELRGVQAAVALVAIGRGERREPPLLGGWHDAKAFPAGRLAVLAYLAFYLGHAHEAWLEEDPLAASRLRAALKAPDNARLGQVLDTLTRTESGPSLEARDFEAFRAARHRLNDWLGEVGLHPPLRLGHKEFDTIASPRDQQLAGPTYAEGNEVAAEALARLLLLLAEGGLPSREVAASFFEEMRLERGDPAAVRAHAAASLAPAGTRLWGVASEAARHYHEAVVFDLPDQGRFILVILTSDGPRGRVLAGAIAEGVFAELRAGRIPVPRELAPVR